MSVPKQCHENRFPRRRLSLHNEIGHGRRSIEFGQRCGSSFDRSQCRLFLIGLDSRTCRWDSRSNRSVENRRSTSNCRQREIDRHRNDLHARQESVPNEFVLFEDLRSRKRRFLSVSVEFYTLTTSSGHEISLTGEHLISRFNSTINKRDFVFAANIELGEQIDVWIVDRLEPSSVVRIVKQDKVGFYAPLTTSGKISIDRSNSNRFFLLEEHFWSTTCSSVVSRRSATTI